MFADSDPCRCRTAVFPSSILPLPGLQIAIRVPGRCAHLVPVCSRHLLVYLRIVTDDQRLATLDVFLVVSHRQSVSDLLILGFFGLWRDVDVHGNMLGGIMQQPTLLVNLIMCAQPNLLQILVLKE